MLVRNRISFPVLIFSTVSLFGHAKVLVTKLQNCDPQKNYKSKFNVTLKTVGDVQYMDGTWVLITPLDNSLKANVSIDMLVGRDYVYLFSINEKKSCEAMNKYFGEFWYDMERNLQMIPGLCPIPKGRYRFHHLLMDYSKVTTVQNFPLGNLRGTIVVYMSSNNDVHTCILVETLLRM